jgi:mono/diheme cytochrome c family protein
MSEPPRKGWAAHRKLWWSLAAIGLVAMCVGGYEIFEPGPTDFAPGKHVALEAYAGHASGVPAELESASLVARGEYLTRAADCVVCHTAKGGIAFAGGRAFVLPFGTMYSTNITPDSQTGIGQYTDKNFLDAVHKGIRPTGEALYPAMPYPSYTYMSDADALAIKAYLFTLQPIHAPAPRNTLLFPFNQRVLMRIWATMFNSDRRFQPNVDQSAEWNRGAYLVEAMEHCGECHTPRNLAFALDNRKKFAGTIQAGWRAYNITTDARSGVGGWSAAELRSYLSTGHADGRGTAAGPMGEAIDESLSHLSASDVAAMVTYLRTTPGVSTSDLQQLRLKPAPDNHADGMPTAVDSEGKSVYEGACLGCHAWSGVSPGTPFATLTGSRAVNDPTATNVSQVIIGGAQRHSGSANVNMPSFGSAYTDAEIASVSNFVTARFGADASHVTPADVAKLRAEN